jgi:hypothetical protein
MVDRPGFPIGRNVGIPPQKLAHAKPNTRPTAKLSRGSRVRPSMSDDIIHEKPSEVDASDGVVSVKGPDAVDVKLTPDAAVETSDRLLKGSLKAHGQRIRARKQG